MSLAEKQQRSAAANAVSGKTARPCDSCLRRRARWYCAADDAFLCQSCDSSVHSANLLARRHDRVRLKTSSSSLSSSLLLPLSDRNATLPVWHQGFKRKARTPRHAKSLGMAAKALVLEVPDLEATADAKNIWDGEAEVDEEEQLLYQVPVFNPVLTEFCSPPVPFNGTNQAIETTKPVTDKNQLLRADDQNQSHGFLGFNPSDIELAEFAADVENLLGQGLDDDSFCIDGLGLLKAREDDDTKAQVKMELMDATDTSAGTNITVAMEMELSRESLEFNFDCGSSEDEVEEHKVETIAERNGPTKVGLRLNYEAVISAWSSRGCSPWTDGERPQFNLDDCWPDFMGMWATVGGKVQGAYGEIGGQAGKSDGGREARVSRYREKRRTRLFSKKIRYEVRKLNAEKRPRMKGRFVKRASFQAASAVAAVAAGGSDAFPYA